MLNPFKHRSGQVWSSEFDASVKLVRQIMRKDSRFECRFVMHVVVETASYLFCVFQAAQHIRRSRYWWQCIQVNRLRDLSGVAASKPFVTFIHHLSYQVFRCPHRGNPGSIK